MRAFTWASLGCLALACGGTAFSSSDAGTSGGTNGDGATSGVLNHGGHNSGGDKNGGSTSGGTDTGGTITGGTTTGGTDVVGGAGGTDVGGTTVGGTDSAGTGGASGGVSSGGSSTGGSATAGSGGGTAIDIVCPKNQPSAGHACKDGLVCSYGTDVRPSCRSTAQCTGGVWGVDKPNCANLDGCGNGVMQGATCDPAAAKPCSHDANKDYCVCTSCAGPVCMVDSATWQCAGAVGSNCPDAAPNEGQACTNARECTYGGCNVGEGVTATCADAVWSWQSLAQCPL